MNPAKLSKLVSLAGAASRAAQSRMGSLRTEEARLTDQLSDLLQSRNSHAREERQVGEAAFSAGADIRWHRWIDSRASQLNMAIAQNRAAQARAKEEFQRLLGRERALEDLLKKAKTATRIIADRRQEWSS